MASARKLSLRTGRAPSAFVTMQTPLGVLAPGTTAVPQSLREGNS